MMQTWHTEKRYDGTPAGLLFHVLIVLRLTLDKIEHKPDLRGVNERVQVSLYSRRPHSRVSTHLTDGLTDVEQVAGHSQQLLPPTNAHAERGDLQRKCSLDEWNYAQT